MQKGSKGGVRKHQHYLVEFEYPQKDARSMVDCIVLSKKGNRRFSSDVRHQMREKGFFSICPLNLKEHERALIIRLSTLYIHNDFEEQFTFRVHMFDSPLPSGVKGESSSLHPDYSGFTKFIVPGKRWAGLVPEGERNIYEPNLFNLGINVLQYAGLEYYIREARSSHLSREGNEEGVRVFLETDPIIPFIMKHKHHFPELQSNDIVIDVDHSPPLYVIKVDFIERVQRFFDNAIFPLIHYTKRDSLYLNFEEGGKEEEEGMIMIMFKVDYVVISPHIPDIYVTKHKLGI